MMGAATDNARLPRFSLVLGIESCYEVDESFDPITASNAPIISHLCRLKQEVPC